MLQTFNKGLLFFLTFGVAGYAIYTYGFLPLGSVVHPDMKVNFQANALGIYAHIFASVLALAIGPLQFVESIRRKHLKVHRWLGRIYLGVGVLIGGVAGLYMSQYAFGGIMAQSGFAVLAVLWLYTGLLAFLAVRRGDIEERNWLS
ncbi:MAG: DUF2306 domain-containing protein [Pseudomonadota bacterium]